jgi:Winged helix DNA-binding domain
MPDASTLPLRLARLGAQRLTDATRLDADPAAIARAVCTVQAQSFDAARHQLRVRSTELTAGAVDRAFEEDRSVVRTWLMRGTLHLCAVDDLRWMLGVLGPNSNRLGESRRIGLGLDEAACRRAVAVMRKVLAHGPLPRRQIREHLVTAGVVDEPVGQLVIHLLFHAATIGAICCGPRMGRDDSFVLLDDWVPDSDGPRGEAALVELARRYLMAYGPASVADFAAWSGLPSRLARAGMAGIGADRAAFPGALPGLYTLGPVASGARSGRPVVRLLGHFDTFLLGYRRRDLVGDATAEAWIHQGGGGWIRPVVCVDGWVVGGWRLDPRGKRFELTVTPFVPLSARVEAGIGREVDSISRFLERPMRWTSGALVG